MQFKRLAKKTSSIIQTHINTEIHSKVVASISALNGQFSPKKSKIDTNDEVRTFFLLFGKVKARLSYNAHETLVNGLSIMRLDLGTHYPGRNRAQLITDLVLNELHRHFVKILVAANELLAI
jgi:hypothetical protein